MVLVKTKRSKGHGGKSAVFCAIKPALFGLAAAAAVSLLFILLFAFVFVIMKSIVSSAIIPLSLFAIIIGCFLGAYICATISGERGLIYGIVIGLLLFCFIYMLGMAMGEEYFGTLAIVKLVLLLLAGGIGGWLGSNHAHKRSRTRGHH